MAVKSKEEIINTIKAKFGDTMGDEEIAVIEDISDTYDSLKDSNGGGKDWKAEAERIDKEWREKYVARFTSGGDNDDDNDTPNDDKKSYNFEDLFK